MVPAREEVRSWLATSLQQTGMSSGRGVAAGTPRWAVAAAYAAVLSVLPSAVWRVAVGFGADLGMPQAWRGYQQVPGAGTVYVVG